MRVVQTRQPYRGGKNLPGHRERRLCIMGCVPPPLSDEWVSTGDSVDAYEHYTGRKRD
jgi:hypothetical protein